MPPPAPWLTASTRRAPFAGSQVILASPASVPTLSVCCAVPAVRLTAPILPGQKSVLTSGAASSSRSSGPLLRTLLTAVATG